MTFWNMMLYNFLNGFQHFFEAAVFNLWVGVYQTAWFHIP